MGAAPRFPRYLAAFALFAAFALDATRAAAFCRSTTCTGDCPRDDDGCKTTGSKLAWPGVCVGVSLQRDGSVNLPMEQVRAAVAASFATWSALDCGGEAATISFSELADVSCHATEFNKSAPNANIILFQDTEWHYKGVDNTLAKTTVTFDPASGAILDADIEINHAYNEFTISDTVVVTDLQSVLTHEIGHFIGLDHSSDPGATMFAAYDSGSITLRTLEADDVAAACAAYPSTRQGKCEPAPRNGLEDGCAEAAAPTMATTTSGGEGAGCALAPASTTTSPSLLSLLGLGLALGARRRSRSRSHA